jgi:site-specific DNA-methyltransferase (adenine-specific)
MTTHQDLIDNLMCKFNGVQIGKSTLFNCDCNDLMAHVPEKHFELSCVDPPYGIGAATGASTNKTMRQKIASGEIKGGNWDSKIPDENYFNELMRVSKNQIIWGGNYFPLPPSKCFFIWDKGESIYGRDFAECEKAWASFDKCARMIKLNPNQLDRIHPTQKPIKLYEVLLNGYAKQGDKILDTHLGSGSHAIACNNLGFELTACELDTDYFEASIKRIEQASKQSTLFEPQQVTRAEQASFL